MAEYFRFLSLPPELRLMIYELLLVVRVHTWILVSMNRRFKPSHLLLHPAILRTCQLVHHEAAPILYGDNLFTFLDYKYNFTRVIGKVNLNYIRHARLLFSMGHLLSSTDSVRHTVPGGWIESKEVWCPSSTSVVLAQKLAENYPNLVSIEYHQMDNWCLRCLPAEKAFEFFRALNQFFKETFPNVERISAKYMDRDAHPFRQVWPRRTDGVCSWADICDYLEENGWILGPLVDRKAIMSRGSSQAAVHR